MNQQELFLASGKSAGVWYCGECRHVWKLQGDAANCCKCSLCGEKIDKANVNHGDYQTMHGGCMDMHLAERRQQALDQAVEIVGYEGYVFLDGAGSHDGYFQSMDELLEWAEDSDGDDEPELNLPEFVHTCIERPFRVVDVSHIVERFSADSFEEIDEHLIGLNELEAALDAFNAANRHLVSYDPDYRRKVRVPRRTESDSTP